MAFRKRKTPAIILNQLWNNRLIIILISLFEIIVNLFIYLGFYVAFNTVQVISRWVVGRAEETSTYSWSRFCTVNYRPTTSNYQLSHLRLGRELNPALEMMLFWRKRMSSWHNSIFSTNKALNSVF